MPQIKLVDKPCPVQSSSAQDTLIKVTREGVRKMLLTAFKAEGEEYLQRFAGTAIPMATSWWRGMDSCRPGRS
jgi:hypothetical protein